jgi:hypothetical protein
MKAPNGLEVEIGDLWEVSGPSSDAAMIILGFETETLAAFCRVWRLNTNSVDFLGFAGCVELYHLISRIGE